MSSSTPVPSTATIKVQLPNGKTQQVNINTKHNPVCEVKRAVAAALNMSPLQQRIKVLAEIDNIPYPTSVQVLARTGRTESWTVSVRNMSERPEYLINLKVDPNDSVLDIKFLLSEKLKVLPDFQRLYIRPANSTKRILLQDHEVLNKSLVTNGALLKVLFEFPSQEEGHGTVHRSHAQLIERSEKDLLTLRDNFLAAAKRLPKNKFLGTRTFLKNGERGDYKWLTYEQGLKRVENIANGFKALGLKERESVGIVGPNRSEWTLTDLACCTQNFISVPLYDTLGPDAVQFIINHASVRIVVATVKELKQLHGLKTSGKVPTLEQVIVMDDHEHEKEQLKKGGLVGFTLTFSQLEKLGADNAGKFPDTVPTADDLSTICYTSGTTGNPKGVMLSHSNLVSAAAAMNDRTAPEDEGPEEILFSYLPLAHIYERALQASMVCKGFGIGFSQGDNTKLVDDVAILRPTIFPGVPRVWQRIYDRIHAQIAESNVIRRTLFDKALSHKLNLIHQGSLDNNTLADKIVISKLAERFGGRVKLMISGAAPISLPVAEFMRVGFLSHFVEGYGLTETAACLTCMTKDDNEYAKVGAPMGCNEVKLVAVPDMEYFPTDSPNPRGEIWVRGNNVFKGYYKQQDITSEVMTSDGWFMTGDIGVWLPDGSLKIIDRKKNIFKLSQGEYIRPEHIENVYKQAKGVGMIYVHGDSNENFLVAVVVPDADALKAFAAEKGLKGTVAEQVKDPRVMQWLLANMEEAGKTHGLRGFEAVKKIHISPEEFSVDNGILTPTFKLKRFHAAKHFAAEIKALYASDAAAAAAAPAAPAQAKL